MPESEKPKLYNCEWKFTFSIREPCPTVMTQREGKIKVRRVVMADRNGKVLIEVSGPTVSRSMPNGVIFRSQRFNVNGYEKYPQAPDWLLEAITAAGFPRAEL